MSLYPPLNAFADVYVRVNQVGYPKDGFKSAVVVSSYAPGGGSFRVLNRSGETVYSGALSGDLGEHLAFPHHYRAEFSDVTDNGSYTVEVDGIRSERFSISRSPYILMPGELLKFFRVQRCGNNGALHHAPCHPHDATRVLGDWNLERPPDLTGGWHDASDYIKYTITTAYSAYLLLRAYSLAPSLFPDLNGNGIGDILDEAKVGLDWMMKMHYEPDKLMIQVQDLQDHSVGWRLPEHDMLATNRPAYYRPSRAVYGSYAAAMAYASIVFKRARRIDYAQTCLVRARKIYEAAQSGIPSAATGPDSMYFDKSGWDNMALAATELYYATGRDKYLGDAVELVSGRHPVHWLSWGDLAGLVYARLGQNYPVGLSKLRRSLSYFQKIAERNPFGYPLADYPWGSASIQMGVAILCVLHHQATGSDEFLKLAREQRDYVLGRNEYGLSYISGFGSDYPKRFHNQVLHLANRRISGVMAEGLIGRSLFDRAGIRLESRDRFQRFQSSTAVYYDDRNDYLTNEPTICNNAQALFLFTWFAGNN